MGQIFAAFMLIGSSMQLASQVNPVSIDLRNNGVKLDAKFYAADKVFSAPTVILLHGYPGNANSPYGLAEILNKNGMNTPGQNKLFRSKYSPALQEVAAIES